MKELTHPSHTLNRRSMLKKSGLALTPFLLGLGSCMSTKQKAFDADIIIVGAGLSGLNAALHFQEFGYKTLIVEATDRLGGRVHTAKESKVPGHPELGANGIGGGYARLLNAAKKYEVEIGPSRPRTEPRKGEILYAVKNELITPEKWVNHQFNPYKEASDRKGSPTSPPWSVYSKLNPLPKKDLTAWKTANFTKWDKSVYEVLKEEGYSDEAIKLGVGTNSSYGVNAKSISVLMYFQIINFINHQISSFSGKGGAAIGGNQRIPEAMGAAFSGDIMMESPVEGIASEADGVRVSLENGKKLRSPYVLVTLPASALRKISISPPPPPKQQKAIQELSYTPCVQIHYVPTKNYWEEDGLPPSMWTDQIAGRFMALKNDLDNPDKVTSCVAYLNSQVALDLAQMEEKEAIAAVTKTLEHMRPSLKGALEPVFHWKWSNNRFAGGAYAYWKPGQITDFANEIALPHGRIHFAGEHTAVINRGMEGAMESGERAALELMNLL